jgi:hypothetical protein
VAEVVFASCIEPDVPGQRVAILVEESHQSAAVVEMAMTDDESINFLCISVIIIVASVACTRAEANAIIAIMIRGPTSEWHN